MHASYPSTAPMKYGMKQNYVKEDALYRIIIVVEMLALVNPFIAELFDGSTYRFSKKSLRCFLATCSPANIPARMTVSSDL